MDTKRCRGCVYWKGVNGDSKSSKFCHYMLDTGKCRLKQMVDGVCTVREERNGRKRREPSFDVPGEQRGL